jgi:hypothetical protein
MSSGRFEIVEHCRDEFLRMLERVERSVWVGWFIDENLQEFWNLRRKFLNGILIIWQGSKPGKDSWALIVEEINKVSRF